MPVNNAFLEMRKAALLRLTNRTPEEIAAKANVCFDPAKGIFVFSSLSRNLTVHYPGFSVEPEIEPWHCLVILHYLCLADGTPLSDREVSFGQTKDAMVRGTDFDRRAEVALARLGDQPESEIRAACSRLGAVFPPSNADLCAVFPFLPNYPITLKLWFADEEFPASGRLFLNGSADHYLTIEDAVTAGAIVLDALGLEKL